MAGRVRRTELEGYLPVRLFLRDGTPRVTWCWFGGTRLEEPFFFQTVERLRRDPANVVFAPETDETSLGEGADPAGLVLHSSRCGSTLVARMLAADPGTRVLSEPEPFDAALRLPGLPSPRRTALLRGLVSAWRPRDGRLSLKLDAASTLDLPLVCESFPGTPRVFLYREPAEVLAANLSVGALRAGNVAFAARAGVDPAIRDDREFGARVLAAILGAAAEDDGALLVRYDELPGAVFTRILPHLGFRPSAEVIAAMREAAGEDAKNPGRRFTAGLAPPVTDDVRRAAERWISGPFQRLEAVRSRQLGARA